MKIRSLLLMILAAFLILAGCTDKDDDMTAPSITFGNVESVDGRSMVVFGKEGGSKTVSVVSARDWTAEKDADWIAISPRKGKAGKKAVSVTIQVTENTGLDRESVIIFDGVVTKKLLVRQKGKGDSEDSSEDVKAVGFREFAAAKVDNKTWYRLTGKVVNIWKYKKSGDELPYGNFDIEDELGERLHIQGMTAKKSVENDKSFPSLGIKVGDIVTLNTMRREYNGKARGGGDADNKNPAYFVKKIDGSGEPEEPEKPGTDHSDALYYTDFGTGAVKPWMGLDEWIRDGKDLGEQGVCRDIAELRGSGVSIRDNGVHASKGYDGASGNNNLWLKAGGNSSLAIDKLNTGDNTSLEISFGANYFDFDAKKNYFKKEFVEIGIKKDGSDDYAVADFELGEYGEWAFVRSAKVKVEANSVYSVVIVNKKTNDGIRLDDVLIEGGKGGGVAPDPGQPVDDEFAGNVTWEISGSAVESEHTVNGVEGVKGVKVGTGKKPGYITFKVPGETETISFYALGWNKKKSYITVEIDGEIAEENKLVPSNPAVAGQAKNLKIDGVTKDNKFVYKLEPADKERIVKLGSGSKKDYRALFFGIKAE